MRIAQIAPLTNRIAPDSIHAPERMISHLTDELSRQGHDVTLFASGDSATSARLEPMWPRGLRGDPAVRDEFAPHMVMLEHVYRHADGFDILHFHIDYLPLSLFSRTKTPFLITLHGPLDKREAEHCFTLFGNAPLVSVSEWQRSCMPDAHYLATVHPGLPAHPAPPAPQPPRYLAFWGRIAADARPDRAIALARRGGLPIRLAATEIDEAYYAEIIRPLVDGDQVRFVGPLTDAAAPAFLAGALALLEVAERPAPFGFGMIEAMTQGTPVLALTPGPATEIVEHGVTGFLAADDDAAVAVMPALAGLSRAQIRERRGRRFGVARMTAEYQTLYRRLRAGRRPLLRVVS